jgi:methyltransferase (TIGR00027 family)
MSELTGVGVTALGVAQVRAHEQTRPDRLFDDPYAAAFVAAAPGVLPDRGNPADAVGAAFAVHTIMCTRFYDDYLLAACESGLRQIVLLAAGLDSRAFRLPWPDGVRLFEIDLPDVLAFKHHVLTSARPRCARTAVAVDLRGDWATALTRAGFDSALPTAWLIEGLLIYLTDTDADRLLTVVDSLSIPESQLASEYTTSATSGLLDRAGNLPRMRRYSSLWRGGLAGDEADWLREHGWQPTSHALGDLAARYGRPIATMSASSLLSAVRAGPPRTGTGSSAPRTNPPC